MIKQLLITTLLAALSFNAASASISQGVELNGKVTDKWSFNDQSESSSTQQSTMTPSGLTAPVLTAPVLSASEAAAVSMLLLGLVGLRLARRQSR